MADPQRAMVDIERFLTGEEAEAALAERGLIVKASTLAAWAASGKVPSHKHGRRRRYWLSELLAHFVKKGKGG